MKAPLPVPPRVRILVRGLNWLGDAVMSTPALLRLRETFPQAHLTVLTHGKLAPLYENHPAINEILSLQKSTWATAQEVRAKGFQIALVLPNSFRSAAETFLARVPCRIGYAANARSLLLTKSVCRPAEFRPMHKRSPKEVRALIARGAAAEPPPPSTAHHVHHYLRLAAELGPSPEPCPPRLAVTDQERDDFRAHFNLPARQLLLGLCPGAEYGPAKRWPLERYAAAATAIQKTTGCHWLIFGTDTAQGKFLAERCAVHDLSDRTSLRQLLAGLSLCRVVVTNDSGPMHAAAALGTRVVVPFGSTSPELTGPGLPNTVDHVFLRAGVPCAPCFLRECPIDHRCMNNISIDAVVSAVLKQLNKPTR